MAVSVIAVQAGTYPADKFRNVTSGLWTPGVVEGMAVSIASLTVTVAVGRCVVPGNRRQYQGNYEVIVDAPVTLTCATGGASQRIDLIIAKVDDHQEDASGLNQATVVVVAGTPGAGQPATPVQCLLLATVTVNTGAGVGTVTSRALPSLQMGGLPTFTSVADRDARWLSPPNGAHAVTLDTNLVWQRASGVWRTFPLTRVGVYNATLDASGIGACVYANPFPAGVVPPVVIARSNWYNVVHTCSSLTNTGFTVQAIRLDGSFPSGAEAVNYIAIAGGIA